MGHAKPDSSTPFPAHRDSGSNQRKPDRDECNVGGVEHRHSVCEQQVTIHLTHSSQNATLARSPVRVRSCVGSGFVYGKDASLIWIMNGWDSPAPAMGD